MCMVKIKYYMKLKSQDSFLTQNYSTFIVLPHMGANFSLVFSTHATQPYILNFMKTQRKHGPCDGAIEVRELGADPLLRLTHTRGQEGEVPVLSRINS